MKTDAEHTIGQKSEVRGQAAELQSPISHPQSPIPNFFSPPTRQAQFVAAARAWLGTPFHAHANVRGAGVDCVHLLGSLYVETGLLTRFNFPKYALDGGSHSTVSLALEWLNACPSFAPFAATHDRTLHVGDLLVFSYRTTPWHVGSCIDAKGGTFIHAIYGAGCCESRLSERTWGKRLSHVYRPVVVGRSCCSAFVGGPS